MAGAIFFWVCSLVAFSFAIGVVVARKPMHSAVCLVLTFIALAGLFLQLHADFIGWILIIVYTGAVMVLIIFVVSLLNLQYDEPIVVTTARRWGLAALAAFGVFFMIYLYRDPLVGFYNPVKPEAPVEWGQAKTVALDLFTRYLLPFELASVLLTAAVIGAIAIARNLPKKDEGGSNP